jgi:hypothetical protein
MRILLIALFIFSQFCLLSQRQLRPLHAEPDYLDHGWSFGAGATVMLPYQLKTPISSYDSTNRNTLIYDGTIFATPKAGWAIEANKMWFKTKWNYFDYWEVGARYYCLRGLERFNGDFQGKDNNGGIAADRKTKFNLHTFGFEARAIDMRQFTDRSWFHHGPVLTADYQAFQRVNRKNNESIPLPELMPSKLSGGINYQIGLGRKKFPGLFVLYTLETPLFTFYPWDEKWPQMKVLNTDWQPIIFTARFILLKKRPSKSCDNRPNVNLEIDKDDPGKHSRKNGLFDEKIKRVKIRKRN